MSSTEEQPTKQQTEQQTEQPQVQEKLTFITWTQMMSDIRTKFKDETIREVRFKFDDGNRVKTIFVLTSACVYSYSYGILGSSNWIRDLPLMMEDSTAVLKQKEEDAKQEPQEQQEEEDDQKKTNDKQPDIVVDESEDDEVDFNFDVDDDF